MHGIAIVPAPVTETTVTFVAHSSIELNDETVGGEFHVDPDRAGRSSPSLTLSVGQTVRKMHPKPVVILQWRMGARVDISQQ